MQPPDLDNLTVSSRDLARVLATSVASISRYVAEGMPKTEAGRYPLVEAVAWYVRRSRERKPASGMTALKERLLAAKAESAEIDNAERRRELLPADEVVTVFCAFASLTAGTLDAVSGRCAPAVLAAAATGELRAVQSALWDEMRSVRSALALAHENYLREFSGEVPEPAAAPGLPVPPSGKKAPKASKPRRRRS